MDTWLPKAPLQRQSGRRMAEPGSVPNVAFSSPNVWAIEVFVVRTRKTRCLPYLHGRSSGPKAPGAQSPPGAYRLVGTRKTTVAQNERTFHTTFMRLMADLSITLCSKAAICIIIIIGREGVRNVLLKVWGSKWENKKEESEGRPPPI